MQRLKLPQIFGVCTTHAQTADGPAFFATLQAIPGVPPLAEGGSSGAANPATWMLDISTPTSEDQIGVDFAELFSHSALAR